MWVRAISFSFFIRWFRVLGFCSQQPWEAYQPLSLRLDVPWQRTVCLLGLYVHMQSVWEQVRKHVFLSHRSQLKTMKGSFLSSLTSHVLSGVPHNNSRKRNINVVGPWPQEGRLTAPGVCSSFLSSRLMPTGTHGNYLMSWPWKEHVFPRIFGCWRLPKIDTGLCLVIYICTRARFIYASKWITFTLQLRDFLLQHFLLLLKKVFEKHASSFNCLQGSRHNDLHSEVNREVVHLTLICFDRT